jgi:hypothetical protein
MEGMPVSSAISAMQSSLPSNASIIPKRSPAATILKNSRAESRSMSMQILCYMIVHIAEILAFISGSTKHLAHPN